MKAAESYNMVEGGWWKHLIVFHTRASNWKRSQISRIKYDDGKWVENLSGLRKLILLYFADLFSTSCPVVADIDNVVSNIEVHIKKDEVQSMNDHVSPAEINKTLMQMACTKALGPNGMHALFYQKNWIVVRPTMIRIVQDFFRTSQMPNDPSHTNITLIP